MKTIGERPHLRLQRPKPLTVAGAASWWSIDDLNSRMNDQSINPIVWEFTNCSICKFSRQKIQCSEIDALSAKRTTPSLSQVWLVTNANHAPFGSCKAWLWDHFFSMRRMLRCHLIGTSSGFALVASSLFKLFHVSLRSSDRPPPWDSRCYQIIVTSNGAIKQTRFTLRCSSSRTIASCDFPLNIMQSLYYVWNPLLMFFFRVYSRQNASARS